MLSMDTLKIRYSSHSQDLVVDNEEVYQLAICGTGRDRVLGEELGNYLQIIPQLITVSSSYNLP